MTSEVEGRQGAGFYRFQVGDFTAAVVSDGTFDSAPIYPVYGTRAPDEGTARAQFEAHALPQEVYSTHCSTMLIQRGNDCLVIDGGCGPVLPPRAGKQLEHLRRAGVTPDSVTHVLVTHGHPDHIGGLITTDRNALTFPNAAHIFTIPEIDFWKDGTPDLAKSTMPGDFKAMFADHGKRVLAVARDAGKLHGVEMDAEILPGVKFVPMAGHTPGHVGVRLESTGQVFEFIADSAFLNSFGTHNPRWGTTYDTFPAQAAENSVEVLRRLAKEQIAFAGCHFTFPSLGHVTAADHSGERFDYHPINWRFDLAPLQR